MEFFGDIPNPGKGLRPLHSFHRRSQKEFSGGLRTPAKDFVLCTPVE
jgi:hypothetical protein